MAAGQVDLSELHDRLRPLGVVSVRPLSGGASSLTYTASIGDGDARKVVVKVAPPGVPPVLNRDVLRQARLLRALLSTDVPVPEVIWEDAGDPPDVPPLFVMGFVEGSSFEPLFDTEGGGPTGGAEGGGPTGGAGGGAEPEAVVARRYHSAARAMAALHRVDPDRVGLGGEPHSGPAQEIERWSRLLDTVDQSLVPGWPEVADLLRRSEPEPTSRSAIVHGDFRLGNLLAVGDRITAVVDWEIWSIGDPRVDAGWVLLNADPDTYRRRTRYAPAVPALKELASTYLSALGYDLPDLGWFVALAAFKSVATWSLIVKHNRRRPEPEPDLEAMTATLGELLSQARRGLDRPAGRVL